MTRNALAHIGSYAVIIAGLLVPTVSYAANTGPYDQPGTNPAQSNCDSKTGCANYPTGDRTRASPAAANSASPYDQGGANPAQSNCGSRTGCANYPTGDRSRAKPARASQAQENSITAQLNQQQLAGRNNQ
jgi:hypothetical protein